MKHFRFCGKLTFHLPYLGQILSYYKKRHQSRVLIESDSLFFFFAKLYEA